MKLRAILLGAVVLLGACGPQIMPRDQQLSDQTAAEAEGFALLCDNPPGHKDYVSRDAAVEWIKLHAPQLRSHADWMNGRKPSVQP